VGIRVAYPQERGNGLADGLDGPADRSPYHALFCFPILFFFQLCICSKSTGCVPLSETPRHA
jgi:hypothetical protein